MDYEVTVIFVLILLVAKAIFLPERFFMFACLVDWFVHSLDRWFLCLGHAVSFIDFGRKLSKETFL